MHTLAKHGSSLRIQRGQAMIEYAILFILLTVLFIGGAELGKTALASYKNTDAAKSAISEYAEINQQRLNIVNAEKQYLTTLASYGCSVFYQITNYGSNPLTTAIYTATDLEVEDNDVTCVQPDGTKGQVYIDYLAYLATNPSPANTYAEFYASTSIAYNTYYDYEDYVQYLDKFYEDAEATIVGSGITELAALKTGYSDALEELHIAPATPNCNAVTGLPVNDWDEDNDCVLSLKEIKSGTAINSRDERNKLKYLLLQEHVNLAGLPLATDSDDDGIVDTRLSEAKIKLANLSNVGNLANADCNGGVINYGLPNRYPYQDADSDGVFEFNDTAVREMYLFHPLSIDITNCTGAQITTLVNGAGTYEDVNEDGEDDNGDFVPGLPKLNQVMYGFYTRVCVNGANEYVSCNVPENITRTLLKPPGKICFANGGANADSCPTQPDEVTGFYRWGQGGTSINEATELNEGFRPAFQLDCAFQSNYASSDVFGTNCNSNPSKVRIHTRYRSVFEGFLNFGVQELQSDAAVNLFYNPNNVSRCGTSIIGGFGSEIGYLTSINRTDCNRNGFPTLKPHKDFRGCYEVDVETNQVSACN